MVLPGKVWAEPTIHVNFAFMSKLYTWVEGGAHPCFQRRCASTEHEEVAPWHLDEPIGHLARLPSTTCLDLQTILVGDPLPSASIPRGFIQFPGSSFFLFGSSGVDKDWLWVDVFGAARGRERTSHAPICGSILYRDMSIDKREVSRRASSFLDMAAEFLLLQLPFCEGK